MAEAPEDALGADLGSLDFLRGVERGFWRLVERVGVRLYIEVSAWSGDTYLLELTCDGYREHPCLGKFVEPMTRACTEAAWPHGEGPFGSWFKWSPGNFFICWPGDRGGIGYHPEWRALQHWKKTANPLVQYLEFVRQCLTIPGRGYQPRSPSLPLAS